MTIVDFIIIIFCIFLVLQGLWKGFLREVFGLLALFTGLAAATHFYTLASSQLESIFSQPLVCDAAGYGAVFVLVWLAIKIMGWLLDKSMGEMETKVLSRLAGGLLGLVKGLLIVSVVVYTAEGGFPGNKVTGPNFTTPACLEIGQWAADNLPFLFSNPLKP
ncbi:MAG: CvpA family protein [Candidatus Glassbacteria bacterium]|nr:CvpA family protein [Candidatus Glassbacteria bacterium]